MTPSQRSDSAPRARRAPLHLTTAATVLVLAGCAIAPRPIDPGQALSGAQLDRQALTLSTQAPQGRVTLEEAMARALLHNRERRVQMMESAMASHQLAVSRYDMLPQLAINAGYMQRDRLAASSSGVFENGQIVRDLNRPTYSVSADRQSQSQSLLLSWSVLDFGLSYLRSEQSADRLLIAKERERKAVHNLIQDVRSAYWRAVSAQKLLKKTAELRTRVQQALEDSRRVESLRLKNPLDALTYQRDLLDIRLSLEALYKDLLDSRTTLATLMGLPPSIPFELLELGDADYKIPRLQADIATLERSALALRPELMELRYQGRVTESEGRSALMSLLPGLSLYGGTYRDTNNFLLYNNWTGAGTSLGMNLFNVFKAPVVRELTDAQAQLAQERRLALTAAVLGQVHLSRVSLDITIEQFESSADYLQVVRKIRDQAARLRTAERSGELDLIREEMAELLADLRRDVAYAELQNSYGRVFVTAGLDPLPNLPAQVDVGSVSAAMRNKLKAWDEGEVGVVLKPISSQARPWSGPGEKSLAIASDSFSLAGTLKIEARQTGGAALPDWLKFDPVTQTFRGNPPAGRESYAIEVKAVDAAGAQVSDRFELKLVDVNDAPQGGALQTVTATEGGKPISGRLDAVDPDGDPLKFALASGQTMAPGFSIEPDGRWRFNPDDPAWRTLKQGARRRVTMQFVATDPHGGVGQIALTLELTGVNNPPEVSAPGEVRLDNTAKIAEGRIDARDVDEDARLTFSVLGQRQIDGFTLQADGRWRFDPAHPGYQSLAAGETKNLFVPIQVSDEVGGSTVARLQIAVTGARK
jgi:VCBS repeat-containing protein